VPGWSAISEEVGKLLKPRLLHSYKRCQRYSFVPLFGPRRGYQHLFSV